MTNKHVHSRVYQFLRYSVEHAKVRGEQCFKNPKIMQLPVIAAPLAFSQSELDMAHVQKARDSLNHSNPFKTWRISSPPALYLHQVKEERGTLRTTATTTITTTTTTRLLSLPLLLYLHILPIPPMRKPPFPTPFIHPPYLSHVTSYSL